MLLLRTAEAAHGRLETLRPVQRLRRRGLCTQVVFRPFVGEVLVGRIKQSDELGIRVRGRGILCRAVCRFLYSVPNNRPRVNPSFRAHRR